MACLPSVPLARAVVIVQPETLVRWHREGFRFYWRWKSRARVGRPRIPRDLRSLIREMSLANPLWANASLARSGSLGRTDGLASPSLAQRVAADWLAIATGGCCR